MNIVIERNVPLPRKKGRNPYECRYPIGQLERGDSFVFPRDDKDYIWRAAKTFGVRVTIRTIDRNTARVWRIV